MTPGTTEGSHLTSAPGLVAHSCHTISSWPFSHFQRWALLLWVLVPNASVYILHLEWILPCFHYSSPKHHAILPVPHTSSSLLGTPPSFVPSTHTITCSWHLCQFRLHFQQTTSYLTYPDGAWLNPTLSLSAEFNVKQPPGKIVVTPTEITRGPGTHKSVSGHCAEQAGKFRTSKSKLWRKWFEYASVFLG